LLNFVDIDIFNLFISFSPPILVVRFWSSVNEENGDGALFLFGVFDGHGRLGHDASVLAATRMPGTPSGEVKQNVKAWGVTQNITERERCSHMFTINTINTYNFTTEICD
jgi:serine/threonine protein phosphatase PrpC